jgi:hypothetical protein
MYSRQNKGFFAIIVLGATAYFELNSRHDFILYTTFTLIFQTWIRIVRFDIFTVVTMKNGVFWDVTRMALVRTAVSEEFNASFIRVTRIGELGTACVGC